MYFWEYLGYHGTMTERNVNARGAVIGLLSVVALAVAVEIAAAVVVGAVLSTMNEDGPL